MSAVIILENPKGAAIYTDAAMYDASGILVGLTSKATIVAGGKLAVMGRGNAAFSLFVAQALERLDIGVDDLETLLHPIIERGYELFQERYRDVIQRDRNEIFVVGWSVRDRKAKIAQWSTYAPAGTPRFSIVENVLAPPPSPKGQQRLRLVLPNPEAALKRMDDHFGMTLMKVLRLDTGTAPGCEGQYLVGGHVLRTDVTSSGITQRVIHEWPEDRVGERIRPTADFDPIAAPNVTPIASMNRQQRRQAERLARKGRAA